MALYLVTYDLNAKGADEYAELYDALRQTPWWHYLQSVWVVQTLESASELYDRLCMHLDERDRILVVKIDRSPRQGWLPEAAWKWIADHE